MEEDIIFKKEGYAILGACYEVYKVLGAGFLEGVYQEALAKEFSLRRIPYVEHPELKIYYKGYLLKQKYIPDYICYNKIIVEIKAVSSLTREHEAQTINYLKATNMQVAYLINFGHIPLAETKRFVL